MVVSIYLKYKDQYFIDCMIQNYKAVVDDNIITIKDDRWYSALQEIMRVLRDKNQNIISRFEVTI